jgi:hypothetical protein
MISPSNADANAAGIGSSLTFILIFHELERTFYRLSVIGYRLECSGHLIFTQIDIDDTGKTQRDRSRSRRYTTATSALRMYWTKAGTLSLYIAAAREISGLDVSEYKRRTNGDGYHMDYRRYIMTKGYDAELKSHFHARTGSVFDHIAHEEGKDSFALITRITEAAAAGSSAFPRNDRYARDISRYQRHARANG